MAARLAASHARTPRDHLPLDRYQTAVRRPFLPCPHVIERTEIAQGGRAGISDTVGTTFQVRDATVIDPEALSKRGVSV